MICNWLIAEQVGDKLNANYDKNLPFTPETSIKNMYYYKGGKNAKRNN